MIEFRYKIHIFESYPGRYEAWLVGIKGEPNHYLFDFTSANFAELVNSPWFEKNCLRHILENS
jgi:hypothetical protein